MRRDPAQVAAPPPIRCEWCGQPLVPHDREKPSEFRSRTHCNRLCSRRHRARREYLDDQHSPRSLAERFWKYVEPEPMSGCWLWVGARTAISYGCLRVGSKHTGSRVSVTAHRISYEIHRGPIPAGLQIDHLCRVPSCVNPGHLEAVTPRVNVLRGVGWAAVNAAKTTCPQGHPYDTHDGHSRRCSTCRPRKKKVQPNPDDAEGILDTTAEPPQPPRNGHRYPGNGSRA